VNAGAARVWNVSKQGQEVRLRKGPQGWVREIQEWLQVVARYSVHMHILKKGSSNKLS
jgi:hypothetical protein